MRTGSNSLSTCTPLNSGDATRLRSGSSGRVAGSLGGGRADRDKVAEPVSAAEPSVPTLMLLAPSNGFGGGIERYGAAVQAAWPGRVVRMDLYRAGRHRRGESPLGAKIAF